MTLGAHEPRIARIKKMVGNNPDLAMFRFVFDWGMFVAEFEGYLVSADVWLDTHPTLKGRGFLDPGRNLPTDALS